MVPLFGGRVRIGSEPPHGADGLPGWWNADTASLNLAAPRGRTGSSPVPGTTWSTASDPPTGGEAPFFVRALGAWGAHGRISPPRRGWLGGRTPTGKARAIKGNGASADTVRLRSDRAVRCECSPHPDAHEPTCRWWWEWEADCTDEPSHARPHGIRARRRTPRRTPGAQTGRQCVWPMDRPERPRSRHTPGPTRLRPSHLTPTHPRAGRPRSPAQPGYAAVSARSFAARSRGSYPSPTPPTSTTSPSMWSVRSRRISW